MSKKKLVCGVLLLCLVPSFGSICAAGPGGGFIFSSLGIAAWTNGDDDQSGNPPEQAMLMINGQAVPPGGTIMIGEGGLLHFDLSRVTSGGTGPFQVQILDQFGNVVFHFPGLIFDWTPPSSGGTFVIRLLDSEMKWIQWTINIVINIVNPPPPPATSPTVSILEVQPTGGTYQHGLDLTFTIKLNVSNGDGRTLSLRCLPYFGDAFNTSFTATNGPHTVQVTISLDQVTNLGNNYFYVFDGPNAIVAQPWIVSIRVI